MHRLEGAGCRSRVIARNVSMCCALNEGIVMGWVDVFGNRAPTVSLSAPVSGSVYGPGEAIVLEASAADVDGTVSGVSFYRDGTTLVGHGTRVSGTASSGVWRLTWTGPPSGTHAITARAVDDLGATTVLAATDVTLTATVSNPPPTITITAPAGGSSFTQGSAIPLSASAADSNGMVSTVEFFRAGGTLIGTGTLISGTASNGTWQLNWSDAPQGTHSLTARATDNDGATTTSTAVTVTVSEAAPCFVLPPRPMALP